MNASCAATTDMVSASGGSASVRTAGTDEEPCARSRNIVSPAMRSASLRGTASMAIRMSRVVEYRRSGSFASTRFRIATSSGGTSWRATETSGTGVKKWWCMIAASVSAWNGTVPVSIWNATTPSEYWSDCGRASFPAHCSGLMKYGVPITDPVVVIDAFSIARATPKSVTITRPSRSTRMLPPFTSR